MRDAAITKTSWLVFSCSTFRLRGSRRSRDWRLRFRLVNRFDPTIRKKLGDDLSVDESDIVQQHVATTADEDVGGGFAATKLGDSVFVKIEAQTVIAITVDVANGVDCFVRGNDFVDVAR